MEHCRLKFNACRHSRLAVMPQNPPTRVPASAAGHGYGANGISTFQAADAGAPAGSSSATFWPVTMRLIS